MRGIEIDAEGMIPEALAIALDGEQDGMKAVYLTPTLHNPSTATMGSARRQSIVDICRRAGAWIIEDGVYAFAASGLPPLAALAPDITLHVNGFSKPLGPGLRIGVLALPPPMIDAAEDIVRDAPMQPAPLSCALVEEWLASGVIASVQKDLGHEAARRSRLAASVLGTAGVITNPAACHAWLPAPRNIADRLVTAAAAIGVRLTPPASLTVERKDQATGIRLCLGGPSFDELTDALSGISGLLKNAQYAAIAPHRSG
jgi:DNA-binding transcriptional MocR family regulator